LISSYLILKTFLAIDKRSHLILKTSLAIDKLSYLILKTSAAIDKLPPDPEDLSLAIDKLLPDSEDLSGSCQVETGDKDVAGGPETKGEDGHAPAKPGGIGKLEEAQAHINCLASAKPMYVIHILPKTGMPQ